VRELSQIAGGMNTAATRTRTANTGSLSPSADARSRRITKNLEINPDSICDSNNGEKVVGTMGGRGGSSRAGHAGTKMKSRRKGSVGAFLHGICELSVSRRGAYTRQYMQQDSALEYDSLFNWSIEDVNARMD